MDQAKLIALLKTLPRRELVELRKKMSSKYTELKIKAFIAANNLVPKTLEKFESEGLTSRPLEENLKGVYVTALATKPDLPRYVKKLSLEMQQKIEDLEKEAAQGQKAAAKPQPKPAEARIPRPAAAPAPTPPEQRPASKPPVFRAPTPAILPGKATTDPVKPKRKMKVAREGDGLVVKVAVGLNVSTSVTSESGAIVVRITGKPDVLNSLVVAVKPQD